MIPATILLSGFTCVALLYFLIHYSANFISPLPFVLWQFLPYSVCVHNVFYSKCLECLLRFCCIDKVIVDKTNKGNDFLQMHTSCPATLSSRRTQHLYKPAYLIGCANNWEYTIARNL